MLYEKATHLKWNSRMRLNVQVKNVFEINLLKWPTTDTPSTTRFQTYISCINIPSEGI